MLTALAARRVANVLRGAQPLADALASAASELRDDLGAEGVALAVYRDGRAMRGQSGALGERATEIALTDIDVDGALLVSGDVLVHDDLALIVTLALAARFLAESAQTDGLTGVANRRTFDARLREEWKRAARDRTSLVVAILDIDYFKVYNDRHGHLAGDDALRRVAHAASATLQRAGDRFARYGGEEFAAILPATSLEGGIAAAERIRAAVAALAIQHPVGKAGRLTVSVGVAATEPAFGGNVQELFAAADRELYRAKAEGRDRVAADGYAREHAADDALPQPFSALIGRDEDVTSVSRAIEAHRVVTVTGAAGLGKTRLALAVAHEAAARFVHVRFVDALGATNRDEIFARIGAALSVTAPGDVAHAVATAVTDPTLVVLDGCERGAEACRDVLDELAGTPLRFLTTSRVALDAFDESVIRLHALDETASRALFADRAAATGVTAEPNDPHVAALLRRLAGSPLAIELAVGRLAGTTAEALLHAFARDHDDSESTDRATLGSLLASAVGALDPDEAIVFGAVAAFRGSFSASDAATVIPVDRIDARRADVLLRAMASRSLLDAASHDGITRWRMIDPVRDAADTLPSAAEYRRAAHAAHVRWCRERLDAIAARSGTGTNRAALMESETVIDEVRAALDRALRDDDLTAVGAELCIAAVRQWFAVRHPHEGRVRCEMFVERSEALAPLLRARLHAATARIAFVQGDLVGTETHARAADALLGDRDVYDRSPVLNFLGIVAKFRGEYDEAERLFRLGREMNVRIRNRRGEAIAIGALGTVAFDFRLDHDEAVERFHDAATIFRELGDDLNALVMQGNLAESLCARGDVDAAAPLIESAIEESRAFGNRTTTAHLLCVGALLHEINDDIGHAARNMREVLAAVDGTPGALALMAFDFTARIVQRAGDDALAAALIGAAERRAKAEATPFLPIQCFWRDPVIDVLRARLWPDYDDFVAHGRIINEAELLLMTDAFLALLEANGPN
ncbi:MAG TPA: diguanylate cyclase [Candidatus Elarobacter sp.]|nr:diguanylate cyclase [Candidatus Elarobacter sp.]